MRKINKINNEKLYIDTLTQWLLNKGYYNHSLDCFLAYDFMFSTFSLSWHKTQKLILKKIPKKILDNLTY